MHIHYHSLYAGVITFVLLFALGVSVWWGLIGVVVCLMTDSTRYGRQPLRYGAASILQALVLFLVFAVARLSFAGL